MVYKLNLEIQNKIKEIWPLLDGKTGIDGQVQLLEIIVSAIESCAAVAEKNLSTEEGKRIATLIRKKYQT